jgi:hypothetical protein
MVNPNRFYTYAYLREDRTPYYIGKGNGDRVYYKSKKHFQPPKDKNRIIFLKQNLTEEEAFRHEIYMISVFGRKDLGTGILHNRTDGGEGVSGLVHNEETRKRMSELKKGKSQPEEHKRKISEAHKGEKNYLSKLWKITKNNGEEILVWGLHGWGKENNYHHNGLYSVYTGKYKKHKDVIKVEVVE